jgi:hypothetical protein
MSLSKDEDTFSGFFSSLLDTRRNLMELTPGEFENLITNLFQRMGLETNLTQTSRDGGVDCVALDPRPALGGKVVVQAKRYKNTVGGKRGKGPHALSGVTNLQRVERGRDKGKKGAKPGRKK